MSTYTNTQFVVESAGELDVSVRRVQSAIDGQWFEHIEIRHGNDRMTISGPVGMANSLMTALTHALASTAQKEAA